MASVMKFLFFLSALILISGLDVISGGDPAWNDLSVTFGFPFTSFNHMPRNVADALQEGFVNISPENDCTNGGQFFGFRYILPGDPGLALLYDIHRVISGMQMNILQSEALTPNNKYNFTNVQMFQKITINQQDMFTLTAYFVEPSTICKIGRSESILRKEGTGTGLFLQDGPTPAPEHIVKIPMERKQAFAEGWSDNKCVFGMGHHNFFRSEEFEQNDCRDIRPYFLLFSNEEKLHGFGFSLEGFYSSPRFEHPNQFILKKVFGDDEVADCVLNMSDSPRITTMHVYFFARPYFFFC